MFKIIFLIGFFVGLVNTNVDQTDQNRLDDGQPLVEAGEHQPCSNC